MKNGSVFDALSSSGKVVPHRAVEYGPLTEGPLVSVVMTTFNVEQFVTTAVMSILNQNYPHLEVIVVDDCSRDGTLTELQGLARNDARMRVIAKSGNDGTYVSKNLGIGKARGKYVALQDSDDWSHPDRLGKSIAVLEARPDVVALTTEWVRMTTDGNLVIQSTGKCAYRSCISLVLKRKEVLSRAGFFDSVRAEGDGGVHRTAERDLRRSTCGRVPLAACIRTGTFGGAFRKFEVRHGSRQSQACASGLSQGV